jgi:hypothetical protein
VASGDSINIRLSFRGKPNKLLNAVREFEPEWLAPRITFRTAINSAPFQIMSSVPVSARDIPNLNFWLPGLQFETRLQMPYSKTDSSRSGLSAFWTQSARCVTSVFIELFETAASEHTVVDFLQRSQRLFCLNLLYRLLQSILK